MNRSFSELLYFSLHFDLSCAVIQRSPNSHDNIPSPVKPLRHILSKNLCVLRGEYVTAVATQGT